MFSKFLIGRLLAVAGLFALPSGAVQAQVLDGGFEDPPGAGSVTNFGTGSTFGAWTVASGNIDLVTNGLWMPRSGTQSVDMSGSTNGTIFQDITTTAGIPYTLNFYLAGNPAGPPPIKTVIVSAGSSTGMFTFDTTGHGFNNMGWTLETLSFVGTGTDRIQFAGQDATFYGAAIDDVSVTAAAVPEPGVVALLVGLSMTSAGFLSRRRKQ